MQEMLFVICSFGWLCAGSLWCWGSEDCVELAPALFWASFVGTTLVWSMLITVVVCTILATVFAVLVPKTSKN